MGWVSGKKPVYKFNPLKITKREQEDFLKGHLKMTSRQIENFKESSDNKKLLKSGKAMTESEFSKVVSRQVRRGRDQWQGYKLVRSKQHEECLEEKRRANIKKTQKLDRKKAMADAMIRKLTGKKGKLDLRAKRRTDRGQDSELTDKEKRVETARNKFINPKKTEWSHAGSRQYTSIYELNADADKDSDVDEVAKLKDDAKNLPDLQI